MRNSSSLDWLRFMHTPNDYRVSHYIVGLRVHASEKIVTVYDNDTVAIPDIYRHYPCRIASLFCRRKLIDE